MESRSRLMINCGRAFSFVSVAFLVFDAAIKFFMEKLPPEALEAGAALQWPVEKMPIVGTILGLCLVLHLIPRTAIVGAVFLTAYLGGAVASHVRVGNPLFSHTLFPVYVGVFIWLGLYMRDARLGKVLS